MVDVFAGVAGFKAMFDTAKNLIGMSEAVARNGAVIGLQEQILSARESYSALLEEKRQLEEKVASFETWESEKQRYVLKQEGRLLVYTLKEGVEPPEPAHSVCPDCYQKRKRSTLQTEHRPGTVVLTCQGCGWEGYAQGRAPEGKRR
jgi:RNase P subunit RPR2